MPGSSRETVAHHDDHGPVLDIHENLGDLSQFGAKHEGDDAAVVSRPRLVEALRRVTIPLVRDRMEVTKTSIEGATEW